MGLQICYSLLFALDVRFLSEFSQKCVCGVVYKKILILGNGGSGKSTLLGGLNLELPLAEGGVSVDDIELSRWHPKELAKRRAGLAQESKLSFPFAVFDVVLMGRSAYSEGVESVTDIEIAERALVRVGLSGLGSRRYTTLSGGERQRVHLARVLAQVWGPTLGARDWGPDLGPQIWGPKLVARKCWDLGPQT